MTTMSATERKLFETMPLWAWKKESSDGQYIIMTNMVSLSLSEDGAVYEEWGNDYNGEFVLCYQTDSIEDWAYELYEAVSSFSKKDVLNSIYSKLFPSANETIRTLNLTQHMATESQQHDGIFEPNTRDKELIKSNLTIVGLPTWDYLEERARVLTRIAGHYRVKQIMIGGHPALMYVLHKTLIDNGLIPMYAFSERVSKEISQEDGTVKKINIFNHIALIPGQK